MSSVYIVTQGCYSDYKILAVFTDEARAQEFAQASHGYDEARIEEWPLNTSKPGDVLWFQGTVYSDGEAEDFRPLRGNQEPPADGKNQEKRFVGGWDFTLQAASKEHAIRIAKERWALHQAEEKGVL